MERPPQRPRRRTAPSSDRLRRLLPALALCSVRGGNCTSAAFVSWQGAHDVHSKGGWGVLEPKGGPSLCLQHDMRLARSKASVRDGEGGQDDGVYLDEETYLQAEDKMLRSDGSLNLDAPKQTRGRDELPSPPPVQRIKNKTYQSAVEGLFSPPPSYSFAEDNSEVANESKSQQELSDEERLYQIASDIDSGKNAQQTVDPEALHQQVFAEEQTYLQQSERFRKSLSSLDEEKESPIAQERREMIEQYNEKVLDDLMKEMDKMEELALSREEAMALAEKERRLSIDDQAKDAVCTRCGLRVTPDLIQRAEMLQLSKDGGMQKVDVPSGGLLCEACYGPKFRSRDEARVRLGAGSYGESSVKRLFDKGNTERRFKGESYRSRRRKDFIDRSRKERRRGDVQGIDTSSLFDIPKGYNAEARGEMEPKEPKSKSRPFPAKAGPVEERRKPPNRSSRMLGGRELAKRMQQQESSVPDTDTAREQSTKPENAAEKSVSEQSEGISEGAVFGNVEDTHDEQQPMHTNEGGDQWVKVEDPTTKRTLYWNTETGEMKKTLD